MIFQSELGFIFSEPRANVLTSSNLFIRRLKSCQDATLLPFDLATAENLYLDPSTIIALFMGSADNIPNLTPHNTMVLQNVGIGQF
jgi:hypothetical protein